MNSFFDWMVLINGALVTLLILVQTRGASLGAGFGSGGEVNTVRRGSDKTLHQLTIIVVISFCLSIIASIVTK
jgi:preprotein translocase subunit SecG